MQAKAGVPDAVFQSVLRANGGQSQGKLNGIEVHVVTLRPGQSETDTAARLAANPNVKFAEVDRFVAPSGTTNDPLLASEWHLSKIGAQTAWNNTTGAGTVIAVLDTGVDGTHPDLTAQMVPGWNFWDNTSNTSDPNGHGTAVAGTAAAASNNGIGVASVAWGARIMPVRIADANGYANWSTIAQGLTWAADHGAKVANISYAVASSSTIQSAAQYMRNKGGLVVVSAGNTGAVDNTAASTSMIVVSATDANDVITSWSTYGSLVDLSAPGYNIYTTDLGGKYNLWWGTSLSSPIVAGVAALVTTTRPDLSPAQVESILFSSAIDLGVVGKDAQYGYGRINAAGAVAAAGSAPTSDTTPPSVAIASPTGGTVTGSVTVNVNATDNVGVSRVDLKVNGTLVASDTAAPYSFVWNSATVANGSASLVAVAVDAKGNTGTSAPVTLTVSNTTTTDTTSPSVAIASPTGGTVSGSVTVNVNATDNVGVSRVDLKVNGAVVASDTAAPYSFVWNSATVPNGSASLVAVAVDAKGNTGTSAPVTVTVSNTTTTDTTPPTVTITSPANGSRIRTGTVTVSGTASDAGGLSSVKLLIDGSVVLTSNTGSVSYKWTTNKVASGTHTITMTASDKAGNSKSVSVTVTK